MKNQKKLYEQFYRCDYDDNHCEFKDDRPESPCTNPYHSGHLVTKKVCFEEGDHFFKWRSMDCTDHGFILQIDGTEYVSMDAASDAINSEIKRLRRETERCRREEIFYVAAVTIIWFSVGVLLGAILGKEGVL